MSNVYQYPRIDAEAKKGIEAVGIAVVRRTKVVSCDMDVVTRAAAETH